MEAKKYLQMCHINRKCLILLKLQAQIRKKYIFRYTFCFAVNLFYVNDINVCNHFTFNIYASLSRRTLTRRTEIYTNSLKWYSIYYLMHCEKSNHEIFVLFSFILTSVSVHDHDFYHVYFSLFYLIVWLDRFC